MNKHVLIILACITASLAPAAQAATETFVREYTYIASDLDSKVSARKNTLKLIKAGVLEEIVSYTSNVNLLEQSQLGDTFEKSFIQSATTMSAGFMRVKVLEEKWDGFQMWIRAEVRANPERIRAQLEDAIAATRHVHKTYTTNPAQPAPDPDPQPATRSNVVDDSQLQAVNAANAIRGTIGQNSADYSGYMQAAKLSEVIALLMPVRMRVNQYRSMHGSWPDEMQDIRLEASEMNDGRYIEAVKLGKDGKIFAFLDPGFGDDKLISYTPKKIMGGMNTRWECVSNISIDVMMQPRCKVDPGLRFDGKSRQ